MPVAIPGYGEKGECELHCCGVEKRCKDSVCCCCQQCQGCGSPGGFHDHVPHGNYHTYFSQEQKSSHCENYDVIIIKQIDRQIV